jgi:predicted RNase H-like HicB family nuclease
MRPAAKRGDGCAPAPFDPKMARFGQQRRRRMNVKIVVHEAEEGGFWAEVPALPGCASQGESMDELLANVREAIQAWLEAEPPDTPHEAGQGRVVELAL